jgi:hypothetical protein
LPAVELEDVVGREISHRGVCTAVPWCSFMLSALNLNLLLLPEVGKWRRVERVVI